MSEDDHTLGRGSSRHVGAQGKPFIWHPGQADNLAPLQTYIYIYIYIYIHVYIFSKFRVRTELAEIFEGECQNGG